MVEATKCGVIGLAIGLGITFVMSLNHSGPWGVAEIMVAVGMASFFGPFGTALGAQGKARSEDSEQQT